MTNGLTEQEIVDKYNNVVEESEFVRIARNIGCLVEEKNAAYGNSFILSAQVLSLMYPDGVKPEQYRDMLLIVRILDKQFRIAHRKNAFGESPYRDIAGYGICGVAADEQFVAVGGGAQGGDC